MTMSMSERNHHFTVGVDRARRDAREHGVDVLACRVAYMEARVLDETDRRRATIRRSVLSGYRVAAGLMAAS